jgi:hypothetical protein
MGKVRAKITGPMNHGQAAAYEFVVDHGQWWPKGSLESGLAATPFGKSLPQDGEKREGSTGNLTRGNFGRRGDYVRLAMTKQGAGLWSSTRGSSERGGAITKVGIEAGCEACSPYVIYRSDGDARHRGKRWVACGGGHLMKPTVSKP